jgi:hypothetical protein
MDEDNALRENKNWSATGRASGELNHVSKSGKWMND